MKDKAKVILAGIIMIVAGLVMFYLIPFGFATGAESRMIKHSGTFIGLLGMGACIAGMLLYLISRGQHVQNVSR